MVSNSTRPEAIVDKNGVATTRHKKIDNGTTGKRLGNAPAPKLSSQQARPFEHDAPADIDVPLAEIYQRMFTHMNKISSAQGSIESYRAHTARELQNLQARGVEDKDGYYANRYQKTIADLENQIEQERALLDDVKMEAEPYEAEFTARGGWSRFYQVTNSNGHVHTSMHCSSCNSSTEFHWHADRSGSTDDEIVADAGEEACTFCFPNAPVDTTNRPSKMDTPARAQQKADRQARFEKKAAADAAKLAKSITNPDGTPLRLDKYTVIKTERAAEMELVDNIMHNFTYLDVTERDLGADAARDEWASKKISDMRTLLTALAAKRGQSEDEALSTMHDKVVAKLKREDKDSIPLFEKKFDSSIFK